MLMRLALPASPFSTGIKDRDGPAPRLGNMPIDGSIGPLRCSGGRFGPDGLSGGLKMGLKSRGKGEQCSFISRACEGNGPDGPENPVRVYEHTWRWQGANNDSYVRVMYFQAPQAQIVCNILILNNFICIQPCFSSPLQALTKPFKPKVRTVEPTVEAILYVDNNKIVWFLTEPRAHHNERKIALVARSVARPATAAMNEIGTGGTVLPLSTPSCVHVSCASARMGMGKGVATADTLGGRQHASSRARDRANLKVGNTDFQTCVLAREGSRMGPMVSALPTPSVLAPLRAWDGNRMDCPACPKNAQQPPGGREERGRYTIPTPGGVAGPSGA